uniref:Phlebovirus glycoprotein G2 fusion domain-containing protein n=1 Tax=Elaeophora elaphi TaxID=1147741 RepID=A0A0R3RN35_9BILA
MDDVHSIIWPDKCGKSNGTVNCKYIHTYPLQQKPTEISISCTDGEVCKSIDSCRNFRLAEKKMTIPFAEIRIFLYNQSYLIATYSNLCYYMVIDNGTLYHTCTCCGSFCNEEIHQLPQRCKLKSMEQFLAKHQLSHHNISRNLFIFMGNHSKSFLNAKSAREARNLAHLRRDYQNAQTQTKNTLFIHYLIKKIVSTHS